MSTHVCDFYIPNLGRGCRNKVTDHTHCYLHRVGESVAIVSEILDQDVEPDTCSICLDSLDTSDFTLEPCKHVFHKTCIERLEFAVCPICRGEFNNIAVKGVYDESSSDFSSDFDSENGHIYLALYDENCHVLQKYGAGRPEWVCKECNTQYSSDIQTCYACVQCKYYMCESCCIKKKYEADIQDMLPQDAINREQFAKLGGDPKKAISNDISYYIQVVGEYMSTHRSSIIASLRFCTAKRIEKKAFPYETRILRGKLSDTHLQWRRLLRRQ